MKTNTLLKRKLFISLIFMLGIAGYIVNNESNAKNQGWTDENRTDWYWATQGSRLIPYSWFSALEQPDSDQSFRDVKYLTSFGFLSPPENNPESLPIGIVVDQQNDTGFKNSGLRWYADQSGDEDKAEKWLGLNCSACHTARIEYKGKIQVVDGGPSLLDFQSFIEELDKALEETREHSEKWDRFASKVLEGNDNDKNREKLKASFEQFLDWQKLTDQMNETPMRYGFGRLDAVGHILNKILMFAGGTAEDGNSADAPVSYPFLWNIWKQDRVQWNGVAFNSRVKLPGDDLEYGALGRNTGEVLGVFGETVMVPNEGVLDTIKGFHSSVQVRNLMRLELILKDLEPPKWPDHFPDIESTLVESGKILFSDNCSSCHLTPDMQMDGEPTERMLSFEDTTTENLTDIWMACNAYINEGPTGPLKGSTDNDGNVFEETAPVANMLAATIKASVLGKKGDVVKEGLNNFFGIRKGPVIAAAPSPGPYDPRAANRDTCLTTKGVDILGYKARPLDGIWATAPYLHNGSVSSLYELLLPAKERSKSFWVGNHEYDPVSVGYETTEPSDGKGFLLKTTTEDGKVFEGNSNHGHDYGASSLTEPQRRALVEYMKTL